MRPDERGPKRPGGAAESGGGTDEDTAVLVIRWREGYAQLAEISERQFAAVKDAVPAEITPDASGDGGEGVSAFEDIWRQLGQLAEEKEAVQRELERVQEELRRRLGDEKLKAEFEKDIRALAEQARVLTLETARKVESLIVHIGGRLGSVRLHRKAMHAYYGMDQGEQVPLYFDEKK
ncbi:MAG: hypothetical protein BAA02_11870 [Paenibacillaceae bacterium ZCTH02-B3]|nr:MAG: hypothetical protein BAA02_11870 [Paenibacillaceae bacterium ZCTH02-B3]